MPTILTNGIQLPDKGSVDWYNSMQSNYNLIDTHLGNTDIHVTAEDKANWNSKQGSLSQAQLDAIAQVATNTSDIATLQSGKANASHTHSSSDITDIGDYATKQYVDSSISGLVDNAPDALNTLNELSAALNDDANFATTVTNALSAKANSADLATVATSGSYNDLSNKPSIPTNTSDLNNDSNFVDTSNSAVASGITSAKVTSYDSHIADTDIHVTTADKTKWNNGVSQSYVLRYSSSSVTDNSTIAYSTLDNTDNVKSGDKVIDVDGKIFSVVSVDTTNQTVTVGSALIDLALDANVVHTSGNETVGGKKTFNDLHIIGYGTQYKGARNAYILPEFAAGYSGLSITTMGFAQALKIGNFVLDANNKPSLDTSKAYIQISTGESNGVNACLLESRNSTSSSLGTSANKWSKIYGTEYYYGSNDIEFSTKFVTTDTNQTIAGQKLFDDINTISSSAEIGVSGGNRSYKVRDKNKKTISSLEGGTFSSGMAYSNWLVNNGSDVFNGVSLYQPSANLAQLRPYNSTLSMQLGSSNRYFSDCYTSKINNLTPSSLGMPSDRTARVDISGYFTNTGSGNTNDYSVPANGYIFLNLLNAFTIICYSLDGTNNINYAQSYFRQVDGQIYILFPVRKNDTFRTLWTLGGGTITVTGAYFIPCQGNV